MNTTSSKPSSNFTFLRKGPRTTWLQSNLFASSESLFHLMSRGLLICWLFSPVPMVKLWMFPKATLSCVLVTPVPGVPTPLSPTATSPTYQVIPAYIPVGTDLLPSPPPQPPPWPCISSSYHQFLCASLEKIISKDFPTLVVSPIPPLLLSPAPIHAGFHPWD